MKIFICLFIFVIKGCIPYGACAVRTSHSSWQTIASGQLGASSGLCHWRHDLQSQGLPSELRWLSASLTRRSPTAAHKHSWIILYMFIHIHIYIYIPPDPDWTSCKFLNFKLLYKNHWFGGYQLGSTYKWSSCWFKTVCLFFDLMFEKKLPWEQSIC